MKCSTPSCTNHAHACGLCSNCYQYIYRATKRGVRWMMNRREKVTLWQERIDQAAGRTNVVHIKQRRRA